MRLVTMSKDVLGFALLLGLAGCFVEPPERPPECFQVELGGGVVLDKDTKNKLQIDKDSDACCENNRDCVSLFDEAQVPIKDLAICVDVQSGRGNGKVCALDCEFDENCECKTARDCKEIDPENPNTKYDCTVGSRAQCDFASQDPTTSDNGFQVNSGLTRCAYCARCTEDTDCQDKPGRKRCNNGVCAECTENNHCVEEGAELCSNGLCVECDEDDQCAEGQSCLDDNTCG